MKPWLCIICILLCSSACSFAQQADSTLGKLANFPNKLFDKIRSKTSHLDDQLNKQTQRYLARLARKEKKLREQLYKIDSNSIRNLVSGNLENQYQVCADKIKSDSSIPNLTAQYMPQLDSLRAGLLFLSKNPKLLNETDGSTPMQIRESLVKLDALQNKLQYADQIKQFISQRKVQIKQCLAQYTSLPKSITDIYNDYDKQLYYYTQQIKEYRETLNNPDKMEKKALDLLKRLPAFKDFMTKNSMLASLFGVPSNYGSTQAIAGLQTREQLQQLIQAQIAGGGPNAQTTASANIQEAQSQLGQLKDKISKLGSSGENIDNPNFHPNNQKTKRFLDRIELGTDFQSQPTNQFFPATTDMGISIGYRLSGNKTLGVGVSYKMGWGEPFSHIKISNQGVGIRSFIELRIKGNFFANGGLEYNYQKPFGSIQQINDFQRWSRSGLIGISKSLQLPGRLVKKTKIQLLWDMLSYYQTPRTQPIKFRVGWGL